VPRRMGSFQQGVFGALGETRRQGDLGRGRHAGRSFHPKHLSTKGAGVTGPAAHSMGTLEGTVTVTVPLIQKKPGTAPEETYRMLGAGEPLHLDGLGACRMASRHLIREKARRREGTT
jgi:hypothetical protein